MPDILRVDNPGDYLSYVGATGRHPLVGVIDFEKISPIPSSLNSYGVYGLFMHSKVRDDLKYGRGAFGHSTGSLICVAPGQIGGREDAGDLIDIDGWALLFHPNLLVGTPLERGIRKFSFFDYSANEAVFLENDEREKLSVLINCIAEEIERPADADRDAIIVSYISVMLHYCNRAYGRQFGRLRRGSDDILVKFSSMLNEYYDRGLQHTLGIPGVRYFADRLCMTPNYFSDLLKKSTGENAGNFIRSHIVRMAANLLITSGSVTQVAYELGFEYPQHFSRMFKRYTGMTPTRYLASMSR